MKKALPATMLRDAERARLSLVRDWVLEQGVTEVVREAGATHG